MPKAPPKACKACSGSGVSSKGQSCLPCKGTGNQQESTRYKTMTHYKYWRKSGGKKK